MKDDVLVKVDRASMAASLEVRTPFLDTELATYVAALPTSFKVHGLSRKWLMKRALRGLVPQAILDRRKQGFALPVADWLRGPLRPLMRDLLSPDALRSAGILEPAPVERLMRAHEEGRADHRKQLWTLLMLELWRRRWGGS
jgi:asparagine synthase (glutamine-hydrolysing)